MEPLEWCRQRLLVPGNPLNATLPFADEARQDAILALRTVIAEIAAAGSEAEVAEARLNWWYQALRENNAHPAVRALNASGVSETLEPAAFDPLIGGVGESVGNPRFESTRQAWQFFRRAGGVASALEARLIEPDLVTDEPFIELGAATYLIRITRDLAVDARANRWLVPLDLQADYQVSRQDAIADKATPAFNGLIRALLSEALGRADLAQKTLDGQAAWKHRHQLLLWTLDRHLATRLARRPQMILERRLLPGHAGNVWRAWRAARRLKKAS
jgi:phytoene synthase